jgi:3D (Asp-Asp-Asp) domain-containing protein
VTLAGRARVVTKAFGGERRPTVPIRAASGRSGFGAGHVVDGTACRPYTRAVGDRILRRGLRPNRDPVARPRRLLGGALAGVLILGGCDGGDRSSPASAPASITTAVTRVGPATSTTNGRGTPLGVFEVTCHTGKGVTRSGQPTSRRIVSVDPQVIPLGTPLLIDELGRRVAGDTGDAVTGRRLDIWEPSAAACARFGRKRLRVWRLP